mmetsp:Transcript_48101/g.142150  ORF Transcript_48101/g.142150 Transcript_48101/m.142150 type:complete len:368 (-) Transcript_48101:2964-4067(-)
MQTLAPTPAPPALLFIRACSGSECSTRSLPERSSSRRSSRASPSEKRWSVIRLSADAPLPLKRRSAVTVTLRSHLLAPKRSASRTLTNGIEPRSRGSVRSVSKTTSLPVLGRIVPPSSCSLRMTTTPSSSTCTAAAVRASGVQRSRGSLRAWIRTRITCSKTPAAIRLRLRSSRPRTLDCSLTMKNTSSSTTSNARLRPSGGGSSRGVLDEATMASRASFAVIDSHNEAVGMPRESSREIRSCTASRPESSCRRRFHTPLASVRRVVTPGPSPPPPWPPKISPPKSPRNPATVNGDIADVDGPQLAPTTLRVSVTLHWSSLSAPSAAPNALHKWPPRGTLMDRCQSTFETLLPSAAGSRSILDVSGA